MKILSSFECDSFLYGVFCLLNLHRALGHSLASEGAVGKKMSSNPRC